MVRAMTTLKPQLVRADTLDLQDHDTPSAKDHSRQPQHPAPYGYGPAAPHQAQTLRHAEEDAYQQQATSPRMAEDQHQGGPYSGNQRFYDDDPEDDVDDEHMNHLHAPNGTRDHDHDYEDAEASDSHDEDMDDDLMDKISSSPSIEDEDIDFEFVYALHTFVATVEGQANATKGDTMVLLDDSNSYWWLVRVVKDGSIGYLPAEHIETPTERLARLNKHRNIDLSASMLGDNPEKSKNPLKKAMRRRNAKTVQFTAPTYYEPSEYEYSDEEEADDSQLEPTKNGAEAEDAGIAQQQQVENADVQVHDDETYGTTPNVNGIQKVTSSESLNENQPTSPVNLHASDPSQASIAHSDSVSRSRKGVVRNTDSFFKDDTAETKKISLTPRLLRGDSDSPASTGQQEIRQRPSEETFDKLLANEDKPKEQAKKEKKGMLSGLFKRKDKATKGQTQQDRPDKISEESLRHSPQSKDSLESLTKVDQGPERKPSKLQKQPPASTQLRSSPAEPRAPQQMQGQPSTSAPLPPSGPAPAPPDLRQVEHQQEPTRAQQHLSIETQNQQPVQAPGRFPSLQEKRSIFSPITNAMKPSPSPTTEVESTEKPVYSKRAKERFAIDASDSEDEQTPIAGPQVRQHRSISPLNEAQASHRRNDSGMQISPIEPAAVDRGPFGDQHESTFDEPVEEKAVTPTQAAETTPIESEQTASTSKPSPSTVTTHTPSTSRSTPTWSDASLRSYMENDQDIKDLLIIVHDKSNVIPVAADHPLMVNLFSNERSKLADMQSQLDSMLMGWMSRKNTTLLSR